MSGFDYSIIEEYNKKVIKKIEDASKHYEIDIERFMPKDTKGKKHPLGVFEKDAEYSQFITQRCKKICIH